MTKLCTKCETEKPLWEFPYDSRRGGRRNPCKACQYEAQKKWSARNVERVRATARKAAAKMRQINPERVRQTRLRYEMQNRSRIAERCRLWAENHPKARKLGRYRNDAKKKGLPFLLTEEQFEDFIFDNCFYCGAHPEPANGIDRVDSSLGYVDTNVVTSCVDCNRAKHIRSRAAFEEWILRAAEHLLKFRRESAVA